MARARWLFVALLLALTAACSRGEDPTIAGPTAPPTAPPTTAPPAPTTTAAPTTAPAPPTTSAAEAIADGKCPVLPAAREADPQRPHYAATVAIDPVAGTASGTMTVTFTPDLPTDVLVFRLWPNAPNTAAAGAQLTVGPVTESATGAQLAADQPDATTLLVSPGRTLTAGQPITVATSFALDVPGSVHDRVSHDGDTLRLGGFLPVLAWEPGYGWNREAAITLFGEASSSPTADYDLTLNVPAGYTILGSGEQGADGVWRATAVRDVAVSVGRFTTVSATENLPAPVTITVGVQADLAENPEIYLDRIVDSMRDYAVRFGPYPWSTFSLAVTADLEGSGIEYPTHVMQGTGTTGRTTPHEVGHMWFYSLVGNNQGRDPWLDEGLASYAEFTHDGQLAEGRATDIPADAEGRTGEPVSYWQAHRTSYYRGVYVQGAVAIASLGDQWMVDCALRHYVADHRFRIARPDDLYKSFEVVFPDVRTRLAPFGLGS